MGSPYLRSLFATLLFAPEVRQSHFRALAYDQAAMEGLDARQIERLVDEVWSSARNGYAGPELVKMSTDDRYRIVSWLRTTPGVRVSKRLIRRIERGEWL
jgi:hypothetical protein